MPELRAVEKTAMHAGSPMTATIKQLDQALRALAADTTRDRFTLVRVVSTDGQTTDPFSRCHVERGLQDGYRIGTAPNFTKVAVRASEDLQYQVKPVTITAATERWAIGQIRDVRSPDRQLAVL